VLPEGWDLAKLLGDHASHPFNPDIANAFFRAGEIESWGRGIQRIFEACRQGGAPEPEIRLSGHDLWTEFPYSPEYLEAIGEGSEKRLVKGSVKKGGKKGGEKLSPNRSKIVEAMRLEPSISQVALSKIVGIGTNKIENNIKYLKENDWIQRIGPAKGGHWEVLK